MTEEQLCDLVLSIIGRIAPEAEIKSLNSGKRFRDQFEFDSVDFLNFALTLQQELEIHIPEEDFPALATLNGCKDYLMPRLRDRPE